MDTSWSYHNFFFFTINQIYIYTLISLQISKVDDRASEDYQCWWKVCKSEHSQRGDQRRPAKSPPMAKLVSQKWSSGLFQGSSVQEISYHHFVQTGPLYRELGVVISSVTSPRFTEAREFGYNFLNG